MTDSAAAIDDILETMTQVQLDALVALHERYLQGRIGGRRASLKRVDLTGLSLQNTQMRQADFAGCVMRQMDLSGADFQEASLYACDLSHANLNEASFVRADLRGARIECANVVGADFDRADLRVGGMSTGQDYTTQANAVNFRGAIMTGARLSGVLANHADFSDAIMTQIDIKNADLRNAIFKGADLTGADVAGVQLSGAMLDHAILADVNLDDIRDYVDISTAITDANVGTSVMDLIEPLPILIEHHRLWVQQAGKAGRQLDLSGYDLRELKTLKREKLTAIRAERAKFFGMNLNMIEIQSAVLDAADFRNCDMEQADVRASSFKGAILNHAKMQGVNAAPLMFGQGANGRFAPCNFSRAQLRYADLRGGHLKSVNFRGADLSYANLTGADLREADLSEANLTGAILDDANTTGAILPEQVTGSAFSLKSLSED